MDMTMRLPILSFAFSFTYIIDNSLSFRVVPHRFFSRIKRRSEPKIFALFDSSQTHHHHVHDHEHVHDHAYSYSTPVTASRTTKDDDEEKHQRLKQQFRELIELILAAADASHIPSLLSRRMDLILAVVMSATTNMSASEVEETGSASSMPTVSEGSRIIDEIVQEMTNNGKDEEKIHIMNDVMDVILSSASDFVEEAHRLDSNNKKLMGKIIRHLADKDVKGYNEREDALDALLEEERDHFTPGFLRHIEGECSRISKAKSYGPESLPLLELLRVVQARVVEELGRDLGEAAHVLGQLTRYESRNERLAILDAGVRVRGISFAKEMMKLADEAVQGLSNFSGDGADPTLVECVQEIRERLVLIIGQQESYQ